MNLKFITEYAPVLNGPDYHRVFSDVSTYHLEDYWLDVVQRVGSLNGLPCSDPQEAESYHIHHSHPIGVGSAGDIQQQYLRFNFECGGKKHEVWTAMPVYVMNGDGKTIQKYEPVRK